MNRMTDYDTKTLDDELRRNDYGNDLVEAFNTLSDDDRNVLLSYIGERCKIVTTARLYDVSPPTMRKRIDDICLSVVTEYERILRAKDETDCLIDYYRRTHEKPKRPVIRVALYEWTPIAEYGSIYEAANELNGNAEKIRNVCNGHDFKYLKSRWFWVDDWKQKNGIRSGRRSKR